jgi:hypothetical protein
VEAFNEKGKPKIQQFRFQSFTRQEQIYKFSLVTESQMSTDNFKNPREKKTSSLETNPPEIQESVANSKEADAAEPIKDPVSELRQMFDKFILATSAQSDRIHNEVLQIKSIQSRQRDEVSDLKSSLIQMSATSSPASISPPKKSSFFFGTSDAVPRPSIQVFQTDIVYDKELKVCSLETKLKRQRDALEAPSFQDLSPELQRQRNSFLLSFALAILFLVMPSAAAISDEVEFNAARGVRTASVVFRVRKISPVKL